jgi:tRNA A37 N6-isopentenylltransferase MiaA
MYRQLNVGANKVAVGERGGVPHHLLDSADLTCDLTVADWHSQAVDAIRAVLDRGRLPIICGGTMLYVRWLLYGPPLTVGTTADTRQRAEAFLSDPTPWQDKSALHTHQHVALPFRAPLLTSPPVLCAPLWLSGWLLSTCRRTVGATWLRSRRVAVSSA